LTTQKGASKKAPPYFDRRIIYTGTSRLVPLTLVIPPHWKTVRITPKKIQKHSITIETQPLRRVVVGAQDTPTNQTSKQNT